MKTRTEKTKRLVLISGLSTLCAALMFKVPSTMASTVSYDTDGDGLIEIGNLAQLNAIRWDPDGDGAADVGSDASAYAAAFPNAAAGMGCAATCVGYELAASLSFDENGDGRITSADSDYWNGGAGWAPIGRFAATFEGNGNVISNLYINRSRNGTRTIGLFGQVVVGGQVRNVGVRKVSVTGSVVVGGLAGQNGGSIVTSYVTGAVTRSGSVSGSSVAVGGLVGDNSGSLVSSYAMSAVLMGPGSVSGSFVAVGGLAGDNSGSLVSSYATSSVTGPGSVSGSSVAVGGLVGDNFSGSIVCSYATGAVTGSGVSVDVGGLVGDGFNGSVVASYWNTQTSGQTSSGGGIGKRTVALQTPTGYTGIYAGWNVDLDNADGDCDTTTGGDDPWNFGAASAYPSLRADYPSLRAAFAVDGAATWPMAGRINPPLCQRTPQVGGAIVAAASGVSSVNDVTPSHLSAITSLDLSERSITGLKARDFQGLTNMTALDLDRNQLSTLPANIFYNLTALTRLELEANHLNTLPADVFEGLTALTWLDLSDNQLSALSADVIDGLTALERLDLEGNQLSAVPADLFEGLTALKWLYLDSNQLSGLPADVFDGLAALTFLRLQDNQLSTLPAGLFDGLTALELLYLHGNSVDPLRLTVSLEKVGAGRVKATAPTGAPFKLVLPLTVVNGSLSGGATTITIPAGSLESQPLAVTRTPGTTAAVTVDIGTFPKLPHSGERRHLGYALVKSSSLPLEILSSGETGAVTAPTDFNGDGRTDFADFFLFADAYGSTDPKFDLDGSGTVDFADFFKFVDAFGT